MTALSYPTLPDGRAVLAGEVGAGGVRFWDADTGADVGIPAVEDAGRVVALAPVPMPDGPAGDPAAGSSGRWPAAAAGVGQAATAV